MEVPEIAQFARNFSVMVRIQGPDPKRLKIQRHAFHLHQSGKTTLSASGLLLPMGSLNDTPPVFDHICSIHGYSGALVVTVASVVEPFLAAQYRNNPSQEFFPQLIPGACIDVLVEGEKTGTNGLGEHVTTPSWLPSHVLALVDVSASSTALVSLIGAHNGPSEHSSWELGWSLATLKNEKLDAFQKQVGNDIRSLVQIHGNQSSDESSNLLKMAKSATRIAILRVPALDLEKLIHINISPPQERGNLLLVMGSPFGVLSPLHFFNSISYGAVANCCPSHSHRSSLLMADVHCLPGMEGGPVFDKHACLTGILTTPLRQKDGRAEIQLVITWDAIATAWVNQVRKEPKRAQKEQSDRQIDSSPFKKALSSIVLVTVGSGAWASGIVLNKHGLILTNAHIVEPWRFGRTSLLGLTDNNTISSVQHGMPLSWREGNVGEQESQIFFPSRLGGSSSLGVSGHGASLLNFSHNRYGNISVRLDHMDCPIWCSARVVYVSKGPLDIALLQLESVPNQLHEINPEFRCPPSGLSVHVIGHGLLGPQSDVCPSVSSGVIANVIKIPGSLHLHGSSKMEAETKNIPVMLQTTAAVHPGASGGAVVNSDGHMIGLVTSNARHGGGNIIPRLNFSIPCAALEPIFKFSEKQDLLLLQVLDKPNEVLSSIWALVPVQSPKSDSPLEKSNREGKGSRFSKFLAEKHAEFAPRRDVEALNKGKLHSKI
ncbi:glyoxysomal processing protease, glyoxysomal [Elaeis guineensis]|uniref:Glyoxysomal processing protease, glyoxysomal isoform X2 n=1 Tax=Elaeis guineensis var. tenera TaxID=51953 RepID=A0A6I9RWB6_ELAGV|nr:glyoxysomal processing protease, glyoxysomal isoform X2 [Elaeis guineensis]